MHRPPKRRTSTSQRARREARKRIDSKMVVTDP
jgi:hypothetical protein